MARLARKEMLDPGEIQIVHTISRCVRRSFLCGDDPYSGESYEHRRQWIRDRLEFLAGIFGIDCLTFSVRPKRSLAGPTAKIVARATFGKSIPAHLSPILERIGLDGAGWCDLVQRFGRLYKRSGGTAEHLAREAQRRGQQWMQAPGNPLSTAS
jgi:hypothetical protein